MDIVQYAKTLKLCNPILGKIQFKPRKDQIRLLNELVSYPRVIGNISRQFGKSTCLMIYAGFVTLTPKSFVIFVCNRHETARHFYNEFLEEYSQDRTIVKKCSTNNEICFLNNSKIKFISDVDSITDEEQAEASHLLIDEFAFFIKERDKKLVVRFGSYNNIKILSTPNGKNNEFYTLYDDSVYLKNNFYNEKYTWRGYKTSQEAAEFKKSCGEVNFKIEYECEFIEKNESQEKTNVVHLRLTEYEQNVLERKARQYHFRSTSEYLRFVGLNGNIDFNIEEG